MSVGTAIVACATPLPAHTAILRLSGDDVEAIARAAGVPLGDERRIVTGAWPLGGGRCPVRTWRFVAPRSFTGEDTIEIALPGAPDLVALAEAAVIAAGAQRAGRGDFARRALAHGRLSLDRVEAILAVADATDAAAAQAAIMRLRGRLADELAPQRTRLLELRALLEAGLDFAEEDGVTALAPQRLQAELAQLHSVLARWQVAGGTLGGEPVVALVGPANAGKSALFRHLSGAAALVSPVAGTTRDVLEASWSVQGRRVTLIDTAGWLDAVGELDAQAIAAGRAAIAGATVVLACSAPDALLPAEIDLPPDRTVIVATKADLGPADARAMVTCSVVTADGCAALQALVHARVAATAGASPRQAELLAQALALVDDLQHAPRDEVLLADDLTRLADLLGDLLGATTPDEILDAIFSRFCIGK